MTTALAITWMLMATTSLLIEFDAAEIFAGKVLRAQKLQRDVLYKRRTNYKRPHKGAAKYDIRDKYMGYAYMDKHGRYPCAVEDIPMTRKKKLRERERNLQTQLPQKKAEAPVILDTITYDEYAPYWNPSTEELHLGDPSGRQWATSGGKRKHKSVR